MSVHPHTKLRNVEKLMAIPSEHAIPICTKALRPSIKDEQHWGGKKDGLKFGACSMCSESRISSGSRYYTSRLKSLHSSAIVLERVHLSSVWLLPWMRSTDSFPCSVGFLSDCTQCFWLAMLMAYRCEVWRDPVETGVSCDRNKMKHVFRGRMERGGVYTGALKQLERKWGMEGWRECSYAKGILKLTKLHTGSWN